MSDFKPETVPSGEMLEAREIRDRVIALVEKHEQERHDGEICSENRVSLFAYLAHSIGVHPGMALDFFNAVSLYKSQHDERHAQEHGHAD
jgi:hypothetical protein